MVGKFKPGDVVWCYDEDYHHCFNGKVLGIVLGKREISRCWAVWFITEEGKKRYYFYDYEMEKL